MFWSRLSADALIVSLLDEDACEFANEEGVTQMLELDASFNTTLAPLPKTMRKASFGWCRKATSPVPNLKVYVAGALDVAISRLGRFGERDQHDIQALLRLSHVDIGDFDRLAREAISNYVGDESRILGNLNVEWVMIPAARGLLGRGAPRSWGSGMRQGGRMRRRYWAREAANGRGTDLLIANGH